MSFEHSLSRRGRIDLPVACVGLISAVLFFAACTGLAPGAAQAVPPIRALADPLVAPAQSPAATVAEAAREAPPGGLTQSAEAGAVIVEITPLNLGNPEANTLDFEVAMNTHSVDLGVDLTKLALLKAGDAELAASAWEAPGGGGHHVTGKLIFPRASAAGRSVLEGATSFSVVIRNLAGLPDRTFTWDLH